MIVGFSRLFVFILFLVMVNSGEEVSLCSRSICVRCNCIFFMVGGGIWLSMMVIEVL